MLKDMWDKCGDIDEYVFRYKGKPYRQDLLWRVYRKISDGMTKIKRLHQASRDTFATRCLEKTKDLQFTQHQLGHSNIQSTNRYLGKYDVEGLEIKLAKGKKERAIK
jgi:integrase